MRGAGDWQPQAGRELGMDLRVKTTESLHTRRHCKNSARGCHAVTKRYVAGTQACASCVVDVEGHRRQGGT